MVNPIRALARALMPQWARQDFSARAVARAIKDRFGQGYRWETILSDYREVRGLVKGEQPIRALRDDSFVPLRYMAENTLRLDRRYRMHAIESYWDEESGEVVEHHISWYTNISGTKEQIEEEYYQSRQDHPEYPGMHVLDLNLIGVEHNEDWDY